VGQQEFLGSFIGLFVGFATQQVLGQAIAGLFILLARSFKIGNVVIIIISSEENLSKNFIYLKNS